MNNTAQATEQGTARARETGGSDNVQQEEHSEGMVAKAIEEQTAKLPSDVFLWAALGSIGTSVAFQVAGKKNVSRFIGQWVAPFLLLGVYNKLVKTHGSDRTD